MRFLIKHHSFKNYWKYWHLSKYVDCTHKCHFFAYHHRHHTSPLKLDFRLQKLTAVTRSILHLSLYTFLCEYIEHKYRAFEKVRVSCVRSISLFFLFFFSYFLLAFTTYHFICRCCIFLSISFTLLYWKVFK